MAILIWKVGDRQTRDKFDSSAIDIKALATPQLVSLYTVQVE